MTNRQIRRSFAQSKGLKVEALQPINMGNCYKCDKPVFAAEGQLVSYYRETATSRITGKELKNERYPVHGTCKKLMMEE